MGSGMNVAAAMVCVAGLLQLPVPDRAPDIHHTDGLPYIELAWGGDVFIDETTVLYEEHLAHELAHWVIHQARVVHGIETEWEENRAGFVQAKYHAWCK